MDKEKLEIMDLYESTDTKKVAEQFSRENGVYFTCENRLSEGRKKNRMA